MESGSSMNPGLAGGAAAHTNVAVGANPAVGRGGRPAGGDPVTRMQSILVSGTLSDANKVSALAQELGSLEDSDAIDKAVRGLISRMPNLTALRTVKDALQRVVDQRPTADSATAPVKTRSAGSSSAPPTAPAVPFIESQNQLAEMFRPPPPGVDVRLDLEQRVTQVFGAEGSAVLSGLAKDYSDLQKQERAATKKFGEGSPQLQAELTRLANSPPAQRIAAAQAQLPQAMRGTLLKLLNYENNSIGKSAVYRSQQAQGMLSEVTALRDLKVSQGLVAMGKQAPVFTAAQRVASPGREGSAGAIGMAGVGMVAGLESDSPEWADIEGVLKRPVSAEDRQSAIQAARDVGAGRTVVAELASVMGLSSQVADDTSQLSLEPKALAALSQGEVSAMLKQDSLGSALPVAAAHPDVFAAAEVVANPKGDWGPGAFTEAGIKKLATMSTRSPAWSKIEAQLDRPVPLAQRELIVSAARQLDRSKSELSELAPELGLRTETAQRGRTTVVMTEQGLAKAAVRYPELVAEPAIGAAQQPFDEALLALAA